MLPPKNRVKSKGNRKLGSTLRLRYMIEKISPGFVLINFKINIEVCRWFRRLHYSWIISGKVRYNFEQSIKCSFTEGNYIIEH